MTRGELTTKRINDRTRAEIRAEDQIADIGRIRAAGAIHDRPRVPLSEADKKFLDTFLKMLASYSVDERAWIKLTSEQRVTIDSMREQHGV
jgi:hypothetical protein